MTFRIFQGSGFSYIAKAMLLVCLMTAHGVVVAQTQTKTENKEQIEAAKAKAQAEAEAKARAEAQARAKVFADIMTKINEQKAAEAKVAKEREASFRKALADQEALTKDAQAKKVTAENLTTTLDKRYAENEQHISELSLLLLQHQGNLGELFGVTRQIAGDAAGVLANSVINSQIAAQTKGEGEKRVDFLRRTAGAKALPSIVELERLWYELMNEMTQDSKTVRFHAPVIQLDGTTTKDMEVVRIGSFTAVSDGQYLSYLPSTDALAILMRQPPQPELVAAARNLQNTSASTGYVPAVVDPARGALMELFVQRPNVFERIHEGQVVGYIIIFVALLGALLAFIQCIYLIVTKAAVSKQTKHLAQPAGNNPLGRMLLAVSGGHAKDSPEVTELRISEAVLKEIPKLERFQAFLRLCVAAGPLLGLIGTVIGMIITFESITASGSSDPKLMAQGIGQAMIATVLGLGCAIPLLFINSGLAALSRSVIHVLEEQSTQLLAKRLTQTA